MKNIHHRWLTVPLIIILLISSSTLLMYQHPLSAEEEELAFFHVKFEHYYFSTPEITEENGQFYVRVNGTNMNILSEGKPVLPINISTFTFSINDHILDVFAIPGTIETIPLNTSLSQSLSYGIDSLSPRLQNKNMEDLGIIISPYPDDWSTYHTGRGIYQGEDQVSLSLRVHPVRYLNDTQELEYTTSITVVIFYETASESDDEMPSIYDLLLITPSYFESALQPLVDHKNMNNMRTRMVTLDEVYDQMYWHGRDDAEKIKYFIKQAIEEWGIRHVLLVGGMKGQTFDWHLPVRYSRVVPWDDQEYAEPQFISDLYYADIYDSDGSFSSWDPNDNDVFAEWIGSTKEIIDYYPDVYLGRLACRNLREVRIMVNKIISYESAVDNTDWFNNYVIVAGDSYPDESGFNEGELIGEKSVELMPDFTPVPVYASEQDINRQTVNDAMNPGAGFAYFCGHGSPRGWNTHYPPDGNNWTTGYDIEDMVFLRNKEKLPVTVVGGCHNAQFNVTFANFIKGILTQRLGYFSMQQPFGAYWYNEWVPNSWAWMLTSKQGGGAIATIANTGLGTHGENDMDNNGIADYLEVLDGWLELRFLEKYGIDHQTNLGMNHGDSLTEYLIRFLGNDDKMDVKMVQQWALLGDPSLEIGGYQ